MCAGGQMFCLKTVCFIKVIRGCSDIFSTYSKRHMESLFFLRRRIFDKHSSLSTRTTTPHPHFSLNQPDPLIPTRQPHPFLLRPHSSLLFRRSESCHLADLHPPHPHYTPFSLGISCSWLHCTYPFSALFLATAPSSRYRCGGCGCLFNSCIKESLCENDF